MEPLSIIIAALVAGAAKPAGEVSTDIYNGLKELIKRRFESRNKGGAVYVLEQFLKDDSHDYEGLLKKELTSADVQKDEEIIQMALKVIEKSKLDTSEGESKAPHIINQAKNQANIVGSNSTQTNTFGS